MTTETTTTTVASSKKSSAKSSGKKDAKKAAKPAASVNGKKGGLRKPQERILRFLAKHPDKSFSRVQISEKAPVDLAMTNSYIGSHDDKIRAKNDKNVCTSLLTLGYIKYGPQSEDQKGVCYQITSTGKKAVEKLAN